MRYDYKCPSHDVIEIEKPMGEAGRREFCHICGMVMERKYHPLVYTWGVGGWDYSNGGMGSEDDANELELRHHQ